MTPPIGANGATPRLAWGDRGKPAAPKQGATASATFSKKDLQQAVQAALQEERKKGRQITPEDLLAGGILCGQIAIPTLNAENSAEIQELTGILEEF